MIVQTRNWGHRVNYLALEYQRHGSNHNNKEINSRF